MSVTSTTSVTYLKASVSGRSSSGAIAATGLQVGDAIVAVVPNEFTSGFEQVVSVADQIQQTTNLDWSTVNITFYLLRGV